MENGRFRRRSFFLHRQSAGIRESKRDCPKTTGKSPWLLQRSVYFLCVYFLSSTTMASQLRVAVGIFECYFAVEKKNLLLLTTDDGAVDPS